LTYSKTKKMKKLLPVWMLFLAVPGLPGQNFHTADINFVNGEPNDTAFVTAQKPSEDDIPDSTYAIPLDGSGNGSVTVPVSDNSIGLDEDLLSTVNYYPNPFNNQMNITFDRSKTGTLDASVFSLNGQKVASYHSSDGTLEMSLNAPEGAYIVHLQGEQKSSAFKVVKSGSAPSASVLKPFVDGDVKGKNGSTKDSLTADYNVSYNPRRNDSSVGRSMFNLDTVLKRNTTTSFDLGQRAPKWDTAFANGGISTREKMTLTRKGNIPLTLDLQQINDVPTNTTMQITTDPQGNQIYSNLITDIDTTGRNQHDSATYKVSWPFVPTPRFDSTDATPSFPGWVAGDTLIKFGEGSNGVTNLFLDRVKNPNIAGKKHYAFRVGVLKDGSPNSQNSIADSALVVINNSTQNTTDSLWTSSSTTSLPNGMEYNAVTQSPYRHGDTLNIAIGNPNDTTLKGYTGMQYVVTGSSYNDIAGGDTIENVMANLVPDTLYSGADPNGMKVPASDIKDMHQKPHYHIGRFDTVGYYINTTGFTSAQAIQNIRDVADSATAIGPTTYVEVQQAFSNPLYSPQTATTFSHGANVQKGSNFISPKNIGNQNIKGESTNDVFADVYVSGAIPQIWKELVFQYHAHDGVNPLHRPSVMNGSAKMPTLLDFVVYTVKNNIETEQFQNNTQNISINYLTDSNNVTP